MAIKTDGIGRNRYGRPKIKSGREVEEQPANQKELVAPASLQFETEHPDVLVIQCSDGRYTHIVAELMRQNGVERYDVMAMPGGPALLDMSSASILQSEVCKSGTSFLIKGHSTKSVWLLAHSGCGYYKYNLNGMPRDGILARQATDLQRAASFIKSINQSIMVYATFIGNENGTATFKSIEIE